MTSSDSVDSDAHQVITQRKPVMENVVTGAISYAFVSIERGGEREFIGGPS